MCDMVKGEGPETVSIDIPFKIVRDTKVKNVLTRSETKDYRVVYNKRVIVDNFDTVPYGF